LTNAGRAVEPRTVQGRDGWLDPALRCAIGLVIAVGGANLAQRRAPASALETPVPSAVAASSSSSSMLAGAGLGPTASAAPVDEVAVRLVDALATAVIERPAEPTIEDALRGTWHRVRDPWVALPADRIGLAQIVSTRIRRGEGWELPKAQEWEPPASLDVMSAWAQRESIVAIAPTTLRFRVKVPAAARLEAEPAVLALGDAAPGGLAGEVRFVIAASETAGGVARELARVAVRAEERERFVGLRVDLAAFAGKEIDLVLRTEADVRPELRAMRDVRAPHPVALWGVPRVLARTATPRLPYDVLFIVVDALRPDVISAFHDAASDAKKRAAPHPPGGTLLPAVDGVVPNLEALAKRSTIFRRATSGSHWTRPGTISMLGGVFADHYGIASSKWIVAPADTAAFYGAAPPLLPLALRRAGATVRALGNNHFLYGWDPMGVDLGFESFDGFEHDYHDTAATARATLATMRAHAGERAFYFVNFNAPHYPMMPTRACMARVPQPENPLGVDAMIAQYRAEACKDDEAIGELLAELDRTGARAHTLVVVTADHGETLSFDHHAADGTLFAHAIHQYEETTRVPILLSLPGVIAEGEAIDVPVSSLDLVPTILRLEGLDPDPRLHGLDLASLAASARATPAGRAAYAAAQSRPILSTGRGTSAIQWSHFRYVAHDEVQRHIWGAEELYDLERDPGEALNLVLEPAYATTLVDLRARLRASLAEWASGGVAAPDAKGAPRLRVRFAGAGVRALRATLRIPTARALAVEAIGLPASAVRVVGNVVELEGATSAEALVGLDLRVVPASAPIEWTFSLDGVVLGDDAVFGGALGCARAGLAVGLDGGVARAAIAASVLPIVDAASDVGVFVVRDQASSAEAVAVERGTSAEANLEVERALKSWGYAK
jgi:arylsulfatase A-like enzyme